MDLDLLKRLIKADADKADVTVMFLERGGDDLFVDFEDELGTLHFHIPNVQKLLRDVVIMAHTDKITAEDAFWNILRTNYQVGDFPK